LVRTVPYTWPLLPVLIAWVLIFDAIDWLFGIHRD
jgi:hypothetical protein